MKAEFPYTPPQPEKSPIQAATIKCVQLRFQGRTITITPECAKNLRALTTTPNHTPYNTPYAALEWATRFRAFLNNQKSWHYDAQESHTLEWLDDTKNLELLDWVLECWDSDTDLETPPPF